MNDDYVSFYSDAQRYDLVMGAYASGEVLNFYRQQVARYGEPVLLKTRRGLTLSFSATRQLFHVFRIPVPLHGDL